MFKPTKEAIGEISPVLHKAQPAINPIRSMRNFDNKIFLLGLIFECEFPVKV